MEKKNTELKNRGLKCKKKKICLIPHSRQFSSWKVHFIQLLVPEFERGKRKSPKRENQWLDRFLTTKFVILSVNDFYSERKVWLRLFQTFILRKKTNQGWERIFILDLILYFWVILGVFWFDKFFFKKYSKGFSYQ